MVISRICHNINMIIARIFSYGDCQNLSQNMTIARIATKYSNNRIFHIETFWRLLEALPKILAGSYFHKTFLTKNKLLTMILKRFVQRNFPHVKRLLRLRCTWLRYTKHGSLLISYVQLPLSFNCFTSIFF